MLIENQTRHTVVASEGVWAKSFWQKAFGLLLHTSPIPLVFRTRYGIHTGFLRYTIDVLILDESNKVVDMNRAMKPWRVFIWNPKYNLVIELPTGRIAESKTKIGDQLGLS